VTVAKKKHSEDGARGRVNALGTRFCNCRIIKFMKLRRTKLPNINHSKGSLDDRFGGV